MVFQCRDEGPLRAKVKWSRSDGLPLPPGSTDINGRLEMPGIMVSVKQRSQKKRNGFGFRESCCWTSVRLFSCLANIRAPNVAELFQMSHMGTYVCTAVEYVGKPGSRVSVYLRIIEGILLYWFLNQIYFI